MPKNNILLNKLINIFTYDYIGYSILIIIDMDKLDRSSAY